MSPPLLSPPPVPQPLQAASLELPFHPTARQRTLRWFASLFARLLPIPREDEASQLASRVVADLPPHFPRLLYRQAFEQAALLLAGGWNALDLRPLSEMDPYWKRTGQPTLFLSMHHGNWEWLAGILHVLRSDSLGVARSAHHPAGQALLRYVRHFHKTPVLYDQDGFRRAHRLLHQGGLVAYLADQRPPTQGEAGSWFGIPCPVTPLPRRWGHGRELHLWVGQLIPSSPTSYHLDLRAFSPDQLSSWDRILDQCFFPWVSSHPELHFGFFHRRLRST